jgi:hypothetical protein
VNEAFLRDFFNLRSGADDRKYMADVLARLERIAAACEQFATDYAIKNGLRMPDTCPGCGAKRDPVQGFIIHVSGCTALWPEGSPPTDGEF